MGILHLLDISFHCFNLTQQGVDSLITNDPLTHQMGFCDYGHSRFEYEQMLGIVEPYPDLRCPDFKTLSLVKVDTKVGK